MARILLPCFSRVIITTPGTFRTSNPADVFAAFCAVSADANRAKVTLVKETGEAVKQALEWGREKGLAILCAGSFYLASEIKTLTYK
jgi:dihydrofolate synthase/folylpolyglutamate synthase